MVYIPSPERGLPSRQCKQRSKADKPQCIQKIKSEFKMHCCMPLCTSDFRFESTLHFHKIPDDLSRKKEWIIKIRRDEGEFFKVRFINTCI